ncbi:polysaccharide biosynthesis C-terminal domain-containing protein [Bacteroidota bacterium]
MNQIKALAGQTVIYGFGTVVPRLLNYLLSLFLYTRIFDQGEYGVITELYAYMTVLLAVLTYGMETGFFRFSGNEKETKKVYSTSLISLCTTTILFVIGVIIFINPISELIKYSSNKEYIIWFTLIVAFDVIAAIPFAYIRKQNKARKFASLKIVNIIVTIVLIFFFFIICPALANSGNEFIKTIWKEDIGLGYVLIANVISSGVILLLLLPVILKANFVFSKSLFKKMIYYSSPLIIVGIAAAFNEAGDKIMLKYLLPEDVKPLEEVGVYGANYKIAVIMTLFVQMFRYAFEPFFFARAKEKDAKSIYADVMKYFVIVGLLIFLAVTMYMDLFKLMVDRDYWGGLHIVPIVLVANLLLGMYYNLSVWYKLTNKTKFAAIMSVMGLIITIILNFILIPKISYLGSAWATLICFASMVFVSYLLGKKYYPVKYDISGILMYFAIAIVFYFVFNEININNTLLQLLVRTIPLVLFLGIIEYRDKLSKIILNK